MRNAPGEGIALVVPAARLGTVRLWMFNVEAAGNRGHGVLVNDEEDPRTFEDPITGDADSARPRRVGRVGRRDGARLPLRRQRLRGLDRDGLRVNEGGEGNLTLTVHVGRAARQRRRRHRGGRARPRRRARRRVRRAARPATAASPRSTTTTASTSTNTTTAASSARSSSAPSATTGRKGSTSTRTTPATCGSTCCSSRPTATARKPSTTKRTTTSPAAATSSRR